jgi:F-type H+-transporting ATPase subunit delta
MSVGIYAREYARLFDRLAPDERTAVQDYLANLGESVVQLGELGNFLDHPAIATADKLKALEAAAPGQFTPVVWRVIGDILKRRMAVIFPSIAEEMERLTEEAHHVHAVGITSAQPLSEAEKDALVEKLTAHLGGSVKPSYVVDPSQLAGLQIKIGDTIIDNTVKTDLEHLRSKLMTISST